MLIQIYEEHERCTFYTVRKPDSLLTETDLFIDKYLISHQAEVLKIIRVMDYIGENGADKYLFRFENRANALPQNERELYRSLSIDFTDFPLRLFCYRLNREQVILFNGGIKDNATAQQSQLSMKFREANQFSKILDENIPELIKSLKLLKTTDEIMFP